MFLKQKRLSSLQCWWPGTGKGGGRESGGEHGRKGARGSSGRLRRSGVWKVQGNECDRDRVEAGRAGEKEEGVWTPAVCRVVARACS